MADFAETLKAMLFTYPGLYPTPLHAMKALFAEPSSTWVWRAGGLVQSMPWPAHSTMSFEDLEEMEERAQAQDRDEVLRRVWQTEAAIIRVRRQLIEVNIEALVQAPTVSDLGCPVQKLGLVPEGSADGLPGLAPPADIDLDWARQLADFLDWWRVRLNYTFGVARTPPHDDMPPSFWPDAARELGVRIEQVRRQLTERIHGKPWQQVRAEQDALVQQILKTL